MNANPKGSGLLEESPVGGFKIQGRILKSAHGRLAASPDRGLSRVRRRPRRRHFVHGKQLRRTRLRRNKRAVPFNKLHHPLPRVQINEFPRLIEHLASLKHQQPLIKPRPHPKCAYDRQPRTLRERSPEPPRRSPHDRHSPPPKHPRNIRIRPRQPVNRVLEHPRNRIVVLRRNQQHPISRSNLILQLGNRLRNPHPILNISVIQRNAMNGPHLNGNTSRRNLRRRPQQRRVERPASQTPRNANDTSRHKPLLRTSRN